MGRRRVHNKSRYGCDRCKERRVKCDEKRPICTACATRLEDCHYSKSIRVNYSLLPRTCSDLEEGQSAVSASISPGPSNPSDDGSSTSRRSRELKLMHFWFMRTSESFTTDLRDIFRDDVFKAAVEHEHLSDFIFALTSFHIASEATDEKTLAEYVQQALLYQNDAFPKFRKAMDTITESNCNAIVFSSMLSMACSLIAPFLVAQGDGSENPPTGCVLTLYHYIDGLASIVVTNRPWLQRGPFRVIAEARKRRPATRDEKATFAGSQLRLLNDTIITKSQPLLHQLYEKAITGMEESFYGDSSMGMTWLHLAGKEFAAELQHERPMGLIILMHWGVLLCKLSDMWWAIFAGKKIVEEVCRTMDRHGDEWNEAKQWAKTELEL